MKHSLFNVFVDGDGGASRPVLSYPKTKMVTMVTTVAIMAMVW